MIKKGFDLFTTSPTALVGRVSANIDPMCCKVCTSPFLNLCKPVCKFRKATYWEWLRQKLGKKGT